ncbi:hypothetical protein [Mycobacterium sp. DL440]|uniref:hypothetical protein n=1 Tax=Mycobacterium sp. DL440 TaxID=2675523 RepID=UPI001423C3B6|nr:hypothetical protein [Mycobacterium sp. DL440]
MPTALPSSSGTAAAGLLAAHELRVRMAEDRAQSSDPACWLPEQSQCDLLARQVQAVIDRAIDAATEVVERELYRGIRAGVAALLAQSSEPAATDALARMTVRWTVVDGELCRVDELEEDVDPGADDMGSTFAQLLAIGLANRAGLGVRWLVQRAREVDDEIDPGRGAARWADIGAVLRITPQAAAKRFGGDGSISACGPICEALEPVLESAVRKRI